VSTNGLVSWQTAFGLTSTNATAYGANGYRYVTNTAPDGTFTVSQFQNGRLMSVTRKDSAGNQLGQTTYTYDPHGRQSTQTDARNGTTTFAYNAAEQVVSVSTPAPGNGQSAKITLTDYDTSLRAWKITQPDGTSFTNEFEKTGLLKKTYGSRTYPVEYKFDAQGRMTNMTTWQNFAASNGMATTTWLYSSQRGWMTKKVYQGETDNSDDYEYKASGRLWKRHWERGVDTTYGYNAAGELESIDYSDSTPDVTYAYDRRGQRATAAANGITTTFYRNETGQPLRGL
jgi:YD repeat-containing protein